MIQAVRYVTKPVSADHLVELSPETMNSNVETAQALLATKCAYWRYEHEHRVVVRLPKPDENGLCFIRFSSDLALKEVILGARCQLTQQNIEDALGNDFPGRVNILQAGLTPSAFKVVHQRKPARSDHRVVTPRRSSAF